MEPIKFHFPPDVAVKCVDDMTEHAKNDPNASEQQRAVFEDIQTLVHFAKSQLLPIQAPVLPTQAPAPAEPGTNHKS